VECEADRGAVFPTGRLADGLDGVAARGQGDRLAGAWVDELEVRWQGFGQVLGPAAVPGAEEIDVDGSAEDFETGDGATPTIVILQIAGNIIAPSPGMSQIREDLFIYVISLTPWAIPHPSHPLMCPDKPQP
jgi:hypothetical protein